MLKMNLIANNLFDRESLTGSLMRHRYSAISGISSIKGSPKAIRGWLRQFHQASPASHLVSQVSKKESKTKETSGLKRGIPLASFDPDTSSWRMSQVSLLPLNRLYTDCYGLDKYGGLRDLKLSELPMPDEYNLTWPKWGMIVAGELFQLTTSVRPISGKGGGLWRTPSSQIIEAKSSVKKLSNRKPSDPQVGLADQVMYPTPATAHAEQGQNEYDGKRGQTLLGAAKGQLWQTPNVVDATGRQYQYVGKDRRKFLTLAGQVKLWPTITVQDSKESGESQWQKGNKKSHLTREIGGTLNPVWVSWLQGWPLAITENGEITDWTDSRPLKELIWLSWDIDPADMKESENYLTPDAQMHKHKTATEWEMSNRGPDFKLHCQVALKTKDIKQLGPIPRVAVRIKDRVNRLKALGNGQVPQCTATAWEILNGH